MANKVSYVKNEEPAFIKAFKQKAGYKEDPGIDAKVLNISPYRLHRCILFILYLQYFGYCHFG